ncbi:vegetative cell wall protein gp1 [Ostrinia furnacalis]|uniref:vegetative cell wall protein gp1 n=1 Tax=Ostrinia furnacalis TaxID=93504 RepID=UPI00103F9B66|nr:vegetative cell wall protein gp1 [Ostrinia furnacalis]
MNGGKLHARAQPPARHSTTTLRPRNMAALPLPVRFLCLLVAGVLADPSPGRVPKVYNALITSNQNLEPSKAYPVYQPVLHDAFTFPYQPAVFYRDFPLTNGIQPVPAAPSKDAKPVAPAAPEPAPQEPPEQKPPAEESPAPSSPPSHEPTPAPPLSPNTQSPIPLNQFGLPPQVLPLGRFDPAYSGFTQVGPFTYTYPNIRFYDPYDPFSFSSYSPYALPSLYRPLGNVLEQGGPEPSGKETLSSARGPAPQQPQAPPSEPSDLNVLNYSSKDPAIPNVPPPPLPDGGLKSDDKSE